MIRYWLSIIAESAKETWRTVTGLTWRGVMVWLLSFLVLLALLRWQYGPEKMSEEIEVVLTTIAVGLIVAILVFVFNLLRVPYIKQEELHVGIEGLETQKNQLLKESPRAVISIEKDSDTYFLLVKNEGVIADFWATLSFGSMIHNPKCDVFARWTHTSSVRTRIPRGEVYKIKVAKLDLHYPGYTTGNWVYYYTMEDSGVGKCSPHYSFVVGKKYREDTVETWMKINLQTDPDPQGKIEAIKFRFKGTDVHHEKLG